MKNYFSPVQKFIITHKVWSGIIAIVFIGLVWFAYGKLTSTAGKTRYILGTAATQTIVSAVSESGQVAADTELSLTPQVSGQIIYVGVVPGQQVTAGTLVAEIDPTDAEKSVRDAQANLQSAQLSLEKLQEPATQLTLTQAQDAVTQAQNSLTTQYQSNYSDVTATFLDLPDIMTGLQSVELGTTISGGNQWNIDYYKNQAATFNMSAQQYRDQAYDDYIAARDSYDQTLQDIQDAPSDPTDAQIESLIDETYKTTQLITTATKSATALIQFYSDQLTRAGVTPNSNAATQITSLNGYLTKAQSHQTQLFSDTTQLQNDEDSLTEKQQSLAQTQTGADTLDLQSAQLNVTKAQNSLQDAQDTLAKYYVRAPFDGTIGSVAAHKYDQSSGAVAVLITSQQLAELSLNEVDAAKLSLGDKATLTFDAIPDFTLTGTVVEIDPVGTVTQGVVTYTVKVGFDSQDSRIKTGMSVNADIQTAVHQNVLAVPSSAIKTSNGQSYVLVFDPPIATSTLSGSAAQGVLSPTPPTQVPVTVGISDSTNTEITSGLTVGEEIVTRTVTGTAASAATAAPAATGAAGGTRSGGGGAVGGGAIRL